MKQYITESKVMDELILESIGEVSRAGIWFDREVNKVGFYHQDINGSYSQYVSQEMLKKLRDEIDEMLKKTYGDVN